MCLFYKLFSSFLDTIKHVNNHVWEKAAKINLTQTPHNFSNFIATFGLLRNMSICPTNFTLPGKEFTIHNQTTNNGIESDLHR